MANIIRGLKSNSHDLSFILVTSRCVNLLSLYRDSDLNSSIHGCLLTAREMFKESDRKASFLFVGDFKAHFTK